MKESNSVALLKVSYSARSFDTQIISYQDFKDDGGTLQNEGQLQFLTHLKSPDFVARLSRLSSFLLISQILYLNI